MKVQSTLWASLSDTFLQTLPELVTPLMGHSLSLCSCQRPLKGLGPNNYDWKKQVSKHACKHEVHPPQAGKKRDEFCLESHDFCFTHAGISNTSSYKRNAWYNSSFLTNLLTFEHQRKKMYVIGQFLETYGVISYSNGWRTDVVNQCLDFGHKAPWIEGRWQSLIS